MSAIEHPRYAHEAEILKRDPIIIAMAEQIRPLGFSQEELGSWKFVGAAAREYEERGGDGAMSIGGVARAIRELLA